MTWQARQGDVFIERIETSAPTDGNEVKRDKGRIVLAEGEATGHSHSVTGAGHKLFERAGSARMLCIVGKGAKVLHEEHGEIHLPPGNYRVVRKREWSGEDERQVAD